MERSNEVVYYGWRRESGSEIWQADPDGLTRINLRDSLEVRRRSPIGFEWGYGGSGSSAACLRRAVIFVSRASLGSDNGPFAAQSAGETPGDRLFQRTLRTAPSATADSALGRTCELPTA